MAEWVEGDGSQDNMISLGFGSYFAPLPLGWTLEPGAPLTGDLVWPRGERLAYSLDCYEDAEAAAGGERLVDLTEEEGYARPESGQAVLDDIHIMISAGGPEEPRPVVWKWMEPFAGTHVRELRLALPLNPDIDLQVTQMTAVVEWMQFGEWAHDRTRLDELAHTAALRRETFGESLLMRVPRDWQTKKIDDYSYAVEPPDEAETLWVSFELFAVTGMEPALFDEFVSSVEGKARELIEPSDRLLDQTEDRIDEYDHLARFTISDEDEEGPLRRIWWRRYSWGEGIQTNVMIHLCTDLERIDEPRFVESAALIEREVRNAAVIPLRPGR